jgi:hypothetical protein
VIPAKRRKMEAFILLKFTGKISEKLKIGLSTEGTIRVDHPVPA